MYLAERRSLPRRKKSGIDVEDNTRTFLALTRLNEKKRKKRHS